MEKPKVIIAICVMAILVISCSRKTIPQPTHTASLEKPATETSSKMPEGSARPKKAPTAKVIVVNDAGAKKTFDGRLYYDLEGKRYWKNYKDGKYYLYDKSQHDNPDFKPPK